jgi:hypothetical protein
MEIIYNDKYIQVLHNNDNNCGLYALSAICFWEQFKRCNDIEIMKSYQNLFSKNPKNYIQLLHFIINKSIVPKINKIIRDKKIYELHKKFIKKEHKGIYAAYSNENIAAKKYYKKNNYILYSKNLFFSFVKKNIY